MNKSATKKFVVGALCVCLFFSKSHAQGDNTYNPLLNLGCLSEAIVMGSLTIGSGQGISDDMGIV